MSIEDLPLIGTVRVDENVQRLAARLEPGEIAIIDQVDLDRASAVSLLSKRPLAVVNVSSSTTGRTVSAGARLLVSEGIPLIDEVGPELLTLKEGEVIEVRGAQISRENQILAQGQLRNLDELNRFTSEARGRLGLQVQAFASGAGAVWQQESALYIEGQGVPRLEQFRSGKTSIVVDGEPEGFKGIRPIAADFDAVIVATSGGAEAAWKLRRGIDVLVGDPTAVPEKILRRARAHVLLREGTAEPQGSSRMSSIGLTYDVIPTAASELDAAILLADVGGAKSVITVSEERDLQDFFELPGPQQIASFFIRTRASSKVVSASVARSFYRPRVSLALLIFLVVAALVIFGVAVLFTPWGQSFSQPWWEWVGTVWPWTNSGTPGG